ncbi:diguanylate cyclase [Pseudomonas sp. KSR10]|uniref:GGDEF domain-containing protein n=2 Tax=unclassified Pseudomonas TaxID=196821 RepID=UPI001EF8FE4F|nr:sensor domain-containing diguanylate cyclase [Pseudomonas sp. KSR10]MCG6538460.1 diguanylate cyclase [Pseudomonas sp. KSR10]
MRGAPCVWPRLRRRAWRPSVVLVIGHPARESINKIRPLGNALVVMFPSLYPVEKQHLPTPETADLVETSVDGYLDTLCDLARRLLSVDTVLLSIFGDELGRLAAGTTLKGVGDNDEIARWLQNAPMDKTLVIADGAVDDRLSNSPFRALGVRFFAGQPLIIAGHRIGAFCLLDSKARSLNDLCIDHLRQWAHLAEGYIRVSSQKAQIAELREALRREQRMAMIDPLTGTWNRLGLTRLFDVIRSNLPKNHRVGIAYCDLDNFKRINERYGHATGDEALKLAAQAMTSILREGDILCRLGGEEFVVLAPVRNESEITPIAERLCHAVRMASVGFPSRLSTSIGTSVLGADEMLREGLHRADAALLLAKAAGKNRVIAAAT